MYEFKHTSAVPTWLYQSYQSIDMEKLRSQALMEFAVCPKITTLGRHADLEETTPLHCVLQDKSQVDLYAPYQNFSMKTCEGVLFGAIKVMQNEKKGSPEFWLLVHATDRVGWLLPYEAL